MGHTALPSTHITRLIEHHWSHLVVDLPTTVTLLALFLTVETRLVKGDPEVLDRPMV